MGIEKTVVIIKHDGVARGLMGQIIQRLERVGLKLVALEFINSTDDMGEKHYTDSEKWLTTVGNRTLTDYKEKGFDPIKLLGTNKPQEIGRIVRNWLIEYLSFGPILAMAWEGPSAVMTVRKLIGDTRPAYALPGTIRGDFGLDYPALANSQKRPMYNLIHASGEVIEAEQELQLWFGKSEIIDYETYSGHYMGIKKKMDKSKKKM